MIQEAAFGKASVLSETWSKTKMWLSSSQTCSSCGQEDSHNVTQPAFIRVLITLNHKDCCYPKPSSIILLVLNHNIFFINVKRINKYNCSGASNSLSGCNLYALLLHLSQRIPLQEVSRKQLYESPAH